MHTYEAFGHCLNKLFAADRLLNEVSEDLDTPGTTMGTFDAFELLRLALANCVYRLMHETTLRLSQEEVLDFGDPGADLGMQRQFRDVVFTGYHERKAPLVP